ncbi:MAG TPA: hypothetical protein VNE39_17750 [Planctomycetota bacterium]|nr:hypothetical protein [Planctomycetota bacterium]
MDINPFGTVSSYSKMLRKIGFFNFCFSLIAVMYLASRVPKLDRLLDWGSSTVTWASITIGVGAFLVAVVFTGLSRIFKLHDRVSDILGIRAAFDVHEILMPMALASGVSLPVDKVPEISRRRNDLMHRVFYKYASSDPSRTRIDPHYVTMALDQWCWYWVVVEAAVIAATTGIVLIISGQPAEACGALVTVALLTAVLKGIMRGCRRYAYQEVQQIMAQEDTAEAVAEVFRAL